MKKKIFIVALAACLLVLSVAGTSIAYFTDTEQYTNTFTVGNVAIQLTVKGETVNGTPISIQDTNVYPAQVLEKDVIITNISANDSAYVGAIVTLTGVDGRLGLDETTVNDFLTGGVMADDSTVATVVYDVTTGTIKIYIVANAAVAKNGTVTIFEDIKIPAAWGNEQMAAFAGLQIDVKAYATQTAGMEGGAVGAIKAAFPVDFANLNP